MDPARDAAPPCTRQTTPSRPRLPRPAAHAAGERARSWHRLQEPDAARGPTAVEGARVLGGSHGQRRTRWFSSDQVSGPLHVPMNCQEQRRASVNACYARKFTVGET